MKAKPTAVSEGLATALSLFRKGAHAEAAALCAELVARDPRNAEALHLLSVIESAHGRPQAATEAAARVLEIMPGHVEARRNLGAFLAQQGRLAEAVGH